MNTTKIARPLITIGHGAYPRGSENALRIARSRAEAVGVLRQRGITRDAARAAVLRAMTNGSSTVSNLSAVIEIADDTRRAECEKWGSLSLSRSQREAFDRYTLGAQ